MGDNDTSKVMVAPAGMELARNIANDHEAEKLPDWEIDHLSMRTHADRKRRRFSYDDDSSSEFDRLREQAMIRYCNDPSLMESWGLDPDAVEQAARMRAAVIVRDTFGSDIESRSPLAHSRLTKKEMADLLIEKGDYKTLVDLGSQFADVDELNVFRDRINEERSRLNSIEAEAAKRPGADPVSPARRLMLDGVSRALDHLWYGPMYLSKDSGGDCRSTDGLPKRKPHDSTLADLRFWAYTDKNPNGSTKYLGDRWEASTAKILTDIEKDTRREIAQAREKFEKARREKDGPKGKAHAADRAKHAAGRPMSAAERARLDKALEHLEKYDPKYFDSDGVRSADLLWFTEDLVYNMKPPMRISRRIRRADYGSRILRPLKFETDPEGRGWGRRLPAVGAVVVVDCSGSMGISNEEVREAMLAAPDSTVIGYSGTGQGGKPNVCLLAEGNRVRNPEAMPRFDASNSCDLSAIMWALDNRRNRPVVWVSDFGVSGIDEYGNGDCFSDQHKNLIKSVYLANATHMCRVGHVTDGRVRGDAFSLLGLLDEWKNGRHFLPGDHEVRTDDRLIGGIASC